MSHVTLIKASARLFSRKILYNEINFVSLIFNYVVTDIGRVLGVYNCNQIKKFKFLIGEEKWVLNHGFSHCSSDFDPRIGKYRYVKLYNTHDMVNTHNSVCLFP